VLFMAFVKACVSQWRVQPFHTHNRMCTHLPRDINAMLKVQA